MSNLQILSNLEFGQIRMVRVKSKPYFVASDIAKALGYKDAINAIKQHCRWVAKHHIPHPQNQAKILEVNVIPEGDIYRLAANSELPQAEQFESWIFDEVLPSLRKTGKYSLHNNPSAILKRHLANANSLGRGLPKPKQIELRRLAVMAAAEESGADYSAVLAVLEAPETHETEPPYDLGRDADLFLQTVENEGNYIIGNKYIHLAPNEDLRICQELDLPRGLILKRLEERGLLSVSYDYNYNGGSRKKHYTAKSPYYNRHRCILLSLNSFDSRD